MYLVTEKEERSKKKTVQQIAVYTKKHDVFPAIILIAIIGRLF